MPVLVIAAALLYGCGGEVQKLSEPRDIGDKVTEGDLELFLQVIDDLPDKRLPELPLLFKRPPAWEDHRTLPVNELVQEEIDELEKLWKDGTLVRCLARDRALQKALRQRMSLPQFVGLVKTLGVALARDRVRPEQRLHTIIEQGKKPLEGLRSQSRKFNELKPEERHAVLTTAAWITRIDRARRLMLVPPENRALVKAHLARLEAIFPAEFQTNPFDSITDQIAELGMSFQELPQTGYDAEIEWRENEVLRGTDSPDPERPAATTAARLKSP
jgi:hypothetical protein